MSQIQIRLRTVVCYEYFAVLIRAHGSRIDVDIRIQLLRCYLKSPCLQKTAQGRCCNTFPQSRYNTACHKNKFCHLLFLLFLSLKLIHLFRHI